MMDIFDNLRLEYLLYGFPEEIKRNFLMDKDINKKSFHKMIWGIGRDQVEVIAKSKKAIKHIFSSPNFSSPITGTPNAN